MRTTFAQRTAIAAMGVGAALMAAPAAVHAATPGPSPVPKSSVEKPVSGSTSVKGETKSASGTVTCDSVGSNSTDWWGNCRVDSGYARAYTYCSDGGYRYGSWVGAGYWKFGGSCGTDRLWDFGYQTSG